MALYQPRFANEITEKFPQLDATTVRDLDDALIHLERNIHSTSDNDRQAGAAMVYVVDRLYLFKTEDGRRKIGFSFPPHDINFTFGQPVFTGTPRLLLRVPELQPGETPIEHGSKLWDKPKLGYGGEMLPLDSVIIFPNYEGPQERVEDRPIVQWSGVRAGEYVIIGGVRQEDEEKILSIITAEIGATPAGMTVWEHYAQCITVRDLSNILYALREKGWGNQYNTNLNYLKDSLPSGVGSNEAGGLFIRNRDLERCVSVFIRGAVKIGFNPAEQMGEDGGFAVFVETRGGQEIRPVSTHFMKENYRYQNNHQPVTPQERELSFTVTHPMKSFETQLFGFLQSLEVINRPAQANPNSNGAH